MTLAEITEKNRQHWKLLHSYAGKVEGVGDAIKTAVEEPYLSYPATLDNFAAMTAKLKKLGANLSKLLVDIEAEIAVITGNNKG